jgi:hypothetical protein
VLGTAAPTIKKRADLVAGFVGQTEAKVKEAVQEARGGVLIVDEVHFSEQTARR